MRRNRMLPLCLASTLLPLLLGCGGPDLTSRAQAGETCAWVPFVSCGEGAMESCCSSEQQCTYRVSDGTDFPCNGADCTQAAHDASAYCKG